MLPLRPLGATAQPAPQPQPQPPAASNHQPAAPRTCDNPRVEPDTLVLAHARREGAPVEVMLKSGRAYSGPIVRWGLSSIQLQTAEGEVVIFKSALESLRVRS